MKYYNTVSVIGGIAGGLVAYCLGGFDVIMQTLVFLMGMDLVTGFGQAVYNKKLNSQVLNNFARLGSGMLKKCFMLFTIMLAVRLEHMVGGSFALREITIVYFIVNEGLSVLENIGKVISYPPVFKQFFEQLDTNNAVQKNE